MEAGVLDDAFTLAAAWVKRRLTGPRRSCCRVLLLQNKFPDVDDARVAGVGS
jgi:hypothetical protein